MSKLTNREMEMRVGELEPFLKRADMVGYAAARNTRILLDELTEYMKAREALVVELGEEELDEHGKKTGTIAISPDSEKFGEFAERATKLMEVEHEPKVFRIPFSEATGTLTGAEILSIDWMFEDTEDAYVNPDD